MKKFYILIAFASLSLSACSKSSSERSKAFNWGNYGENNGTSNVEGNPPAAGPDSGPVQAGEKKFKLEGIPSGSSDIYDFTLTASGDVNTTHFSYKLATPDDCKKSGQYQVEVITAKLNLSVAALADGPVALCILKYNASSKTWQNVADATVFSWTKVVFKRKISATFTEFDPSCMKDIATATEIEFVGNVGSYTWKRDAKSQGCDQETEEGKDSIMVQSNDAAGLKGFWTFTGGAASGWLDFQWSNKERTAFTGKYGYGDPSLAAAGTWNSK